MASVCVIGGGVGGLAVAARLGAKRHEVTILEQSSRIGGQLHTAHNEGFAFDVGPSMLTLPAVFRDLFLKTGRPLEDEVDLKELEPGFTYHFADDSTLTLPGGSSGRTAAAIGEQFNPQAGEQWRQMTRKAADMWRLLRDTVLYEPISSREQVAASAGRSGSRRALTLRRGSSLHKLAREIFADPRLVQVIDNYAAVVGSDPRRAPDSLITLPFVEQAFGLWHITGGMGQLSDALQRRCESLGVKIETDTEVTEICTDTSGVTSVRCIDGSFRSADIVISDVDATALQTRLLADERARPRSSRRTGRLSYSKFIVQLGIRSNTSDNASRSPQHLVWFPKPGLTEFDDLRRGRTATDPTIRATRNSDPAMAPPGYESWCLQVSAPRHGHGAAEHDWTINPPEDYATHLIELLASRGTDIGDRIVSMSVQTPADFTSEIGSPGGSLSGAAMQGSMWAMDRPRNISPVPGLFLVGGTTHPGPGLPYVGLSAEIVAETIGRAK